jgi:elongation factor P hydroxylase
MSYKRPILARYRDPLELIWLATANRLGVQVRRDPGVFANTDGDGVILIGNDDLDPDDNMAKMLFHEVCHWIINGRDSVKLRDWGFDYGDPPDTREHACIRLEALLAQPHGLRLFFAPTGKFREYYDRVGDPLEMLQDSTWEREVQELLRAGVALAAEEPFGSALQSALRATAQIQRVLIPFKDDYRSDIAGDVLKPLWFRDLV